MTIIGRYFWFLLLGVVLINAAIWRSRFRKLVELGRVTEEDADSLLRAIVWGLGIPIVILGFISLRAHLTWPLCARIVSFRDSVSATSSIVTLALWLAILLWVWAGPGADLLSRMGPVLWNRPNFDRVYSPKLVRLFVTGLIILSALGSTVAGASQSSAVDPLCNPPAAAG